MSCAARPLVVALLGLTTAIASACSPGTVVLPARAGPLRCSGAVEHFELDLISDAPGSATPVAAAEKTAENGVPGFDLPTNGWVLVRQEATSATVRSDDYQVDEVRGLSHSWLVVSGFRCAS